MLKPPLKVTNVSRGRLARYSAGLESPWEQSLASSNLALGAILLPDDVLILYHVDLRTYDPNLIGVKKGWVKLLNSGDL